MRQLVDDRTGHGESTEARVEDPDRCVRHAIRLMARHAHLTRERPTSPATVVTPPGWNTRGMRVALLGHDRVARPVHARRPRDPRLRPSRRRRRNHDEHLTALVRPGRVQPDAGRGAAWPDPADLRPSWTPGRRPTGWGHELRSAPRRPPGAARGRRTRSRRPRRHRRLPRLVFGEVVGTAEQQGVGVAGAPFARYRPADDGGWDIEAGFPVTGTVSASGRVEPVTLPGGRRRGRCTSARTRSSGTPTRRRATGSSTTGTSPPASPGSSTWTAPRCPSRAPRCSSPARSHHA